MRGPRARATACRTARGAGSSMPSTSTIEATRTATGPPCQGETQPVGQDALAGVALAEVPLGPAVARAAPTRAIPAVPRRRTSGHTLPVMSARRVDDRQKWVTQRCPGEADASQPSGDRRLRRRPRGVRGPANRRPQRRSGPASSIQWAPSCSAGCAPPIRWLRANRERVAAWLGSDGSPPQGPGRATGEGATAPLHSAR